MARPTKKEISKYKEAARNKRKTEHERRKAVNEPEERENPITIEVTPDGDIIFHGRSMKPTKDKNAALSVYNKVLWNYGLQLCIIPGREQSFMINKTIGCARNVRNDYLDTRIKLFQEERRPIHGNDYKKDRLRYLKDVERPWLKEVDKFALEAAIEHVDDAYRSFFEGRADFPKFASRYKPNGNRYTTKFTNNNIRLEEKDGLVTIRLPKIGKVPVVMPKGRTLGDLLPKGVNILSACVARDKDRYTVSLALETVIDKSGPLKHYQPDRVIAADMGLKIFCDYDNGDGSYTHVDNPGWIKQHERRLRRFQRKASRRRYDEKSHRGSKNWKKAQALVAKEQRKIADQRKDFHHKLSREIVDKCDVFICEDLNIKGMLKNRHLSKAISSVGWGQFLSFIKYKLERKGGLFLKVSRWFPSSKLCSCGHKYDLSLNERWWICPKCFKFHDRDDHAVDNLREEGLRILSEQGILAA